MGNQDKINFIREKCIEANDDIVALKFGCEITWSYDHYMNLVAKTRVTKHGFVIDHFPNFAGTPLLLVRLERDRTTGRAYSWRLAALGPQ